MQKPLCYDKSDFWDGTLGRLYKKYQITWRIITMSTSVFPWLTVRQYEGVTNTKEAERLVKEGLVPLIAKLPGFISYYWTDAGNGVMISVSVYTNKEAEEESNRIAADFVKQHMAALLPNPSRITAGHVVTMAQKKYLSRVFLDEK